MMLKNNCQCDLCRSVWGVGRKTTAPGRGLKVAVLGVLVGSEVVLVASAWPFVLKATTYAAQGALPVIASVPLLVLVVAHVIAAAVVALLLLKGLKRPI